VSREGKERGRALGEVEGRWDPTGARGAASLRARHAGSGTHRPSAREVRNRPSVPDGNISPFPKS
jgi:hypothetical protein